ncbi:Myb family transcription factor PHL5 [Linum perenne]
MNSPKIDFHDGLNINQFMGQQETWSNLESAMIEPSSSCIVSRFESPASAFYATERYMGLQQYDSSHDHHYQDSDISVPKQSYCSSRQLEQLDFKPFQLSERGSGSGSSTSTHQQFVSVQDHKLQVGMPFSQMGFRSGHENLSPGSYNSGGGGSGPGLSNKTRIRWTQDLHEKFVECVNRLGGADKATPKAILKLMDSEGLTIFHVKSHLQKYRIAKYMPDTSEGMADRRSMIINDVSQLDTKARFQIREALQLQLDVQRRLHEQLEIQRNLQVRIEEQSKQLQMMFDHQQHNRNTSSSNSNNNDPNLLLMNSSNLLETFNVITTTHFHDAEASIAPEERPEIAIFPSKIS